MPWVLIVAAIVVGAIALHIRADFHRDSTVLIQVPAKSATSTSPSSAKKAATGQAPVTAETLVTEKKTTTEKPTSESTFATLFGIATVLLLLGAFYTRVSKITVAGNSLEFSQATTVAAQDSEAVGAEVGQKIVQKARASGDQGPISAEDVAKLVEAGVAAAARMQSQAASLRRAAGAMPAVARTTAVPVSPDELEALGSGMPLPDALLKKLADEALKDVEAAD